MEAHRRAFVLPAVSLVAVLLLIIGIAAVVSSSDDEVIVDPIALLEGAPDAAREAGSARMQMSVQMGGEGMSMSMDGSGLVDFESGAGSFTMSTMGTTFEMLTDGETLWMKMPAMARPAGVTQEWVAMPVAGMGQGQLQLPGSTGAAGFLDSLRGIGDTFEELGTREVNGVEANGYRVTVDLTKALAEVPADQREQAEASLEQLQGLGSTTMPMEVWITDDGLPVRMTMEMAAADLFDMKMQIDFTDFGVEVDITPPPEDQVYRVDDPSQLGGLMGDSGTTEIQVEQVEPAA